MNVENTRKLEDKYPFLRVSSDPYTSDDVLWDLKVYGLMVEDGWYDLLDELCAKISKNIVKEDDIVVYEVKTKFGGLRFYAQATKEIQKIIDQYERRSFEICEFCGKKGDLSIDEEGWYRTLCDSHRDLTKSKKAK